MNNVDLHGTLQRSLMVPKPARLITTFWNKFGQTVRTVRTSASADKKALSPAEPGSVKEYYSHVFIRSGASSPTIKLEQSLLWRSPDIEREAPFKDLTISTSLQGQTPGDPLDPTGPWIDKRKPWKDVKHCFHSEDAFENIERLRLVVPGRVKVTAYEEADGEHPPARNHCDLLIYPESIRYSNLPLQLLQAVIEAHLVPQLDNEVDQWMVPDEALALQVTNDEEVHMTRKKEVEERVCLFVCSHMKRDVRCGLIGPALVKALKELTVAHGLQDRISVKYCSHVGGHKYAGNVLVFGSMTPCDGDWYGGVNPENAAAFFLAIANMRVDSDGGPQEPGLKGFWRGRMGLSMEEQKQFYECGCLPRDEGSEEEEDEEEEGDDREHKKR